MMPVRGDITTNETFTPVLEKLPALQGIAGFIPNAVPCMSHPKMTEIQTAFGDKGLAAYMLEATKEDPFNAPDATPYVEAAFEAMKEIGALK